jgi:hypothetical protein
MSAAADRRRPDSNIALTAAAAAAAIARGDISAESYVSDLLARAKETADLGAFVSWRIIYTRMSERRTCSPA